MAISRVRLLAVNALEDSVYAGFAFSRAGLALVQASVVSLAAYLTGYSRAPGLSVAKSLAFRALL